MTDDTCTWPACKADGSGISWMGRPLCDRHWLELIDEQDNGLSNDELLDKLRRPAGEPAEESVSCSSG